MFGVTSVVKPSCCVCAHAKLTLLSMVFIQWRNDLARHRNTLMLGPPLSNMSGLVRMMMSRTLMTIMTIVMIKKGMMMMVA